MKTKNRNRIIMKMNESTQKKLDKFKEKKERKES